MGIDKPPLQVLIQVVTQTLLLTISFHENIVI